MLIHQNFCSRASTTKATKRWVEELAVLGGVDTWGWSVTGKKEHNSTPALSTNESAPVTTVMGVRKKRKPSTSAPIVVEPKDKVQSLDTGLVRKKQKIEPAPVAETSNGVNTLTAGLVRKKPKA
jgi:regulator of Ty1 transposition protein 109